MNLRKELLKKGFWYFIFNTIFLLIIAIKYFRYINNVENIGTFLYLLIATISHFISLSFILYIPYVIIISIFPNKKTSWISASVLSTIGTIFLLLDSMIFDLYRMHINKFTLELVFGGNATQIFEFSAKQYFIVISIITLLLGFFFTLSYFFFNWKKTNILKGGKWVVITTVIFMFTSHVTHAWADANSYIPITKSSRYYPLYFPTTSKSFMYKLNLVDEEAKKKNIILFSSSEKNILNYPKSEIICDSTSNTNIIFLLLDSWYYKAYDSITAPNIYEFSKKCEVFNHHYSGSNGTRTGVFSMFYGIPGILWDDILATQTSPILMDVLQKNHYTIQTYPSASISNPPIDRTVFGKIDNVNITTEGRYSYDRDIQLTKNWINDLDQIEKSENPFFSLLFFDAMHAILHPPTSRAPFQPAWDYPKYEVLHNNIDETPFLNLYKNSLFFVDSLVGVVLNEIKERGLLENSWIFITGDHGQEFNDNKKNYWGHNGNYSAAQMQIPFMLYTPDKKNKTYNHWSSHYDLVPTMLTDIFNCKNDIFDYSIGQHLRDTTERSWMIVGSSDNYAILQDNKITSVYFNGTFDITDGSLNTIKNAKLQNDTINMIMKKVNTFYK